MIGRKRRRHFAVTDIILDHLGSPPRIGQGKARPIWIPLRRIGCSGAQDARLLREHRAQFFAMTEAEELLRSAASSINAGCHLASRGARARSRLETPAADRSRRQAQWLHVRDRCSCVAVDNLSRDLRMSPGPFSEVEPGATCSTDRLDRKHSRTYLINSQKIPATETKPNVKTRVLA